MKRNQRGIIFYGILFLCILTLLAVYLMQTVATAKKLNAYEFSSVHSDYRYHFMVDTGCQNTTLERELLRGMQESADKYGIVLEVNGYNSSYSSLTADFITWVGFTNPDAVIVGYPVSEEQMKKCPDIAGCVVYNGPQAGSFMYVGPDNYAQGTALAEKLIQKYMDAPTEICLLYTKRDDPDERGRLQGFMDGIRENQNILVTELCKSDLGILNGMGVAEEVLLSDKRPDCFVCLDETLLTGAVRAVVDLNQVSDISVCGIGMSDEISRYMANGLVDFSIDSKACDIGKMAVENLYEFLQKESEIINVYTEFELVSK